jgi:hypothetical protein
MILPISASQVAKITGISILAYPYVLLLLLLLFIYAHVHTLFGSFLPPALSPTLSPLLPSLPGRACSTLISNFVEEKT